MSNHPSNDPSQPDDAITTESPPSSSLASETSKTPTSVASRDGETSPPATSEEPPPSYVKLAMRNMVKKGGKSLYHFALTTLGLLGLLVGLAYITR